MPGKLFVDVLRVCAANVIRPEDVGVYSHRTFHYNPLAFHSIPMSLSIGIVGLPNVGKSTLFKAVTNKQVDIQNYPFTTIEPNIGVVEVPDERIDIPPACPILSNSVVVRFVFSVAAAPVRGASTGEGL